MFETPEASSRLASQLLFSATPSASTSPVAQPVRRLAGEVAQLVAAAAAGRAMFAVCSLRIVFALRVIAGVEEQQLVLQLPAHAAASSASWSTTTRSPGPNRMSQIPP